MMSILRGACPAPDKTGCSAPLGDRNLILETLRRAWRVSRESWRTVFLEEAFFGLRRQEAAMVAGLQRVDQPVQQPLATCRLTFFFPVEILGNKAGGRL